MKKQNINNFIEKFHFLDSQKSSDEINWSCSDSSDYENNNIHCRSLNNVNNEVRRKRKRVNNRKKDHQNISNLDITFVNLNSERKISAINAKSPILVGKSQSGVLPKSPILTPLQHASRITSHKTYDLGNCSTKGEYILKSPIIHFKCNSPNVSPKVRKKLFKEDKFHDIKSTHGLETHRSTSPILSKKKDYSGRSKCTYTFIKSKIYNNKIHRNIKHQKMIFKEHQTNEGIKKNCEHEEISIEFSSSDESIPRKSQQELVAKVKSYFDNYFSEASQISISECGTPTPKNSTNSSNEIDVNTPMTQEKNVTTLSKDIQLTNTIESHTNVYNKKVKYKKGGLAFRLNVLLKKQNTSVTLWQHERFLAANSNFVIPKQEFLAFRIKNVNFKYGLCLLDIVDKDDEFFTAAINSIYVNDSKFEIDCILKIYEPYKIISIDKSRIICNICKFECKKLIMDNVTKKN